MALFGLINKAGSGAIGEVVDGVGNMLDGLITNKEEKAKVYVEFAKMQSEITKLEAASGSRFIGGWRPFIGWVCGVSLGMYYIPQFAIASYIWAKMCLDGGELLMYPSTNSGSLNQLVMALLGMGALRGVDKIFNKSK